MTSTTWTPQYAPWRHGGWYVTNVRTASGAMGCVSRNYSDRKWRIVCDPRPDGHSYTYPTRDAAARAERELAEASRLQAERAERETNVAAEPEAPSAPKRAPLTVADVLALADIVLAARKRSRVARAFTDQPSAVVYGTVQSIVGDERGSLLIKDRDIRDCYLRVTTDQGDVFWLLSELIGSYWSGNFSPDYTG